MKRYLIQTFILGLLFFHVKVHAQFNRANVRNSTPYRSNYQRMSSGCIAEHTFEIRSGELWAWGRNSYGKLGDGTSVMRTSPVRIGTSNDWVSVKAGFNYSLGIKADGTLWAWGLNTHGELGDGTQTTRSTPVQIGTDRDWVSIAAGFYQSAALKANGTMWGWGDNTNGQLGDGTYQSHLLPTQIGTDHDWIIVDAGYNHSYGLKANGTIWAWGDNTYGLLGVGLDGNVTPIINYPVQIGNETNWTSIVSGGNHGIAIKADGTIWGWGDNYYGQLGDNTTDEKWSPVQIGADNDWITIVSGNMTSYALKSNGTLWAWGENSHGQYGDGSSDQKYVPSQIGIDNHWVSMTAGYYQMAALKADGHLWSCGSNSHGQVGDGTVIEKHALVEITTAPNDWLTLTSGGCDHTAGLKADGSIWAWGKNTSGQLGSGNTTDQTSPQQVGTDHDWKSVVTGCGFTLALKSNGTLWGWGSNNEGQLGTGVFHTVEKSPVQIGTANTWTSLSAGELYSMALKADGTLWAWGSNLSGQMGYGSGDNFGRNAPGKVGTENNWVSITAGANHNIALKANGTLWAWGSNLYGNMGDGTTSQRPLPQQVGVATDWRSVSTAGNTNAGIKADGTIMLWGANSYGQVGNGTSAIRQSSLLQIGTDHNWLVFSLGKQSTIALKADGTLWDWGYNGNGQLGDGTTVSKNSPQQTDNHVWSAVFGSRLASTYGLKPSRNEFCATGDNTSGTLGDGTTVSRLDFNCYPLVTAIQDHQRGSINELTIYPNPSNGSFTIQAQQEGTYTLMNNKGQALVTFSLSNDNEYSFTLENIQEGIYFIVGLQQNKKVSKKIMVLR